MKTINKPAILGGKPTFNKPFKSYVTIGIEEKNAVNEVLKSGTLSGFIGAWCPEFFGGEKVQKLERLWKKIFNAKHAVTMNSATSCLYSAIGAIGIEPGDEVIVTPTTMTATVTGIVLYQGIPIFADVCPNTYCIDPNQIKNKITKKTKAIIGVDIYGETAEWNEIKKIAKKYNIKTIEDSAQSLGGLYDNKKSGTLADIGIFSLNRHKHIHSGEGGICITDNAKLADRLRLIRNHGEAVVGDKGDKNLVNLIGFNYRMTEIEAAIAIAQLKKLKTLVNHRRKLCLAIIGIFKNIDGITPPKDDYTSRVNYIDCCGSTTKTKTKHVYYYLCFKLDKKILGMSRNNFVKSLIKEGIPLGEGGYMPVYLQPMYQKQIAFGSKGYPFKGINNKKYDYSKGICPIAEEMWFEKLFYFQIQNYVPTLNEIKRFKIAIKKVLDHKKEINLHFKKINKGS